MSQALQVVEQKTVLFYEDEITAVRVASGTIYVPIKPLCERLGVAWSPQLRRINRDAVLSKKAKGVTVTVTSSGTRGGGPQEMICLPLSYLNGWMFGINANRVKEEIRDRLIRYQEECYDALYEAFQEGRLTGDKSLDELLQGDTPAAQAYRMAQAVMQIARQRLFLEEKVEDHEGRIGAIEAKLTPDEHTISEAQASEISQAVKAVAMELSKTSGRNEYGGVYGELYRRFEISSYKRLPADRFPEAMDWLNEWYQSLVSDAPF
jgi:hypothetical protein